LTNEQKIRVIGGQSVVSGNTTWNGLVTGDGGAGDNMQFYVSAFSMPSATTMTWNKSLIEAQFRATGDEFYGMGVNLVNGPVVGPLGRDPYGGRLPEGFSPDPYLSGIALGLATSGMNGAGVITAARHYLLNEQETNRMRHSIAVPNYSANTDDKTAQELYVWPYADAVQQGLMAVMCAMNRVNESQSCENAKIIQGYLKAQIGFPGLVLPDVASQFTPFGSANGGLDLGSSGIWNEATMLKGLEDGNLTQARLDDMAVRNMMGYYFVGQDNGLQPGRVGSTEYRSVRGNHSQVIRQVGREALVLLKNDNTNGRGLPLNKPRTMALFGSHAGPCSK
jgi:beta-glucosidase